MANPNNAIGTNGAFGGRTSVNALNDVLATFTGSGVISGWAITPSAGMTVQVGGQSGLRDVAIAQDNNGNRTTVDNRLQSPVEIEIDAAPTTGSRTDAIVAYVENPPQGVATVVDNPSACGILSVAGTAASSPTAPTDSTIRAALTSLGVDGATAYVVVLGTVTVPSGTTDIDATMISTPLYTSIPANKLDFTTINSSFRPITSARVTSTSSNYAQVGFSHPVTITFPVEVGARYLVTANGTFGTNNDVAQVVFAFWDGAVGSGIRIGAASGSSTVAGKWSSYEFIRGIYAPKESKVATLTLSCGCGGTSASTCTLLENTVFNVQRTT